MISILNGIHTVFVFFKSMYLSLFLEESPPAGTEAASGSETMAGLVASDLNGDWSEMYESPL